MIGVQPCQIPRDLERCNGGSKWNDSPKYQHIHVDGITQKIYKNVKKKKKKSQKTIPTKYTNPIQNRKMWG